MEILKNTLIQCKKCNGKIMVKPSDLERGEIKCSHKNCDYINTFNDEFHFDSGIIQGLPSFGKLIYLNKQMHDFSLKFGSNIIGTSESADVYLTRSLFIQEGQCFISRQHCTLEIKFDRWFGSLRYSVFDGFYDSNEKKHKKSLNGTTINALPLKESEIIDVVNGDVLTIGGVDKFRLETYSIPLLMLETYKTKLDFDPDRTQ